MIKILLPDPELFVLDIKERNPVESFYNWVLKASNPAVEVLFMEEEWIHYLKYVDISKFNVHIDYYDKFKKAYKNKIMRSYKYSAKRAELLASQDLMNYGPSTAPIDKVKKKSKRHVYLLDGYLERKPDEQR